MYNGRLPPQPPQEPHTFGDNITSNATGQKESDREHIFTTNIKLASCKKQKRKDTTPPPLEQTSKVASAGGAIFSRAFSSPLEL